MNKSIDCQLKKVIDLLNNKDQYIMPDFQRGFVWGKNEIDTLFNDFNEDTENFTIDLNKLSGYLLGNIVLIRAQQDTNLASQFEVIDGQQRLTTLTLIFCALYIKFNELYRIHKDERWTLQAGKFSEYFRVLNTYCNFEDYRIKHEEESINKEIYQRIIKSTNDNCYKEALDTESNISKVFIAILDQIDSIASDNIDNLFYLKEYLQSKVYLIVTIAPDVDRAYQLFEVLNNRGLMLEPMDLLKNHLLRNLKQINKNDIGDFMYDWKKFSEQLKQSNKKINTNIFVKHFLLGTLGEKVREKYIFNYFKEKGVMTGKEILSLAKQLNNVSKVYSSIECSALKNNFINDSSEMYIIFELLNTKQSHAFLIPFYDASIEQKQRVLDVLVKYVASVIFSFTNANNIEKDLPGLMEKIIAKESLEEKVAVLESELKALTKKYISNLKSTLPGKNLAGKNKRKPVKGIKILKFIELYFNQNENIKTLKKIEVEHIMPLESDIKDYGFKNSDEFDEYLNRLGNLTLLTKKYNISATNKQFSDKKEHYRASEFLITKGIVEKLSTPIRQEEAHVELQNHYFNVECVNTIDIWSKEQIEKRNQLLTDLLVDILSSGNRN